MDTFTSDILIKNLLYYSWDKLTFSKTMPMFKIIKTIYRLYIHVYYPYLSMFILSKTKHSLCLSFKIIKTIFCLYIHVYYQYLSMFILSKTKRSLCVSLKFSRQFYRLCSPIRRIFRKFHLLRQLPCYRSHPKSKNTHVSSRSHA